MRRPPRSCTRRFQLGARASTAWNSSSSSATPRWSTRGTRQCPGWTTTLTAPRCSSAEPQLEAVAVELLPRDARLGRDVVVADPAVARDEIEAELAEVARLDVPQLGS